MGDADFRRELAQQLRVDSVLLDGHLTLDFQAPADPRNDHLIFSKGHASPDGYAGGPHQRFGRTPA